MNGRRQFLKGAGLFSALLAGATVARSATAATAVGGTMLSNNNSAATRKATANAVKQIEEHNVASLALTQTYGTIAPPPPPADFGIGSNGNFSLNGIPYTSAPLMVNSCGNVSINGSQKQFVPGTEKRTEVKMAPGPDGELYININGNWKKVVTA